MADKFSTAIGIHFGIRKFTKTTTDADFYVYDDENEHHTIITNNPGKALHVKNPDNLEIRHIPVDGGIIEWAQPVYNEIGKNGRPECMLYSEYDLYYAELKTNASSPKKGNANALHGMHQIEDFVCFLHTIDGIPYPKKQHAVVCIDKSFVKRNAAFLNETERFRQNTGIKILFDTEITFEDNNYTEIL